MKTYKAHCYRSDGWWVVDVPTLRGVHTQARRLDQATEMARDAIALFLDVPEKSFDVRLEVEPPRGAQKAMKTARDARREAEHAERAAAKAWRDAAIALVKKEGLTMRDAGSLLGLSFQRVQQLVNQGTTTRRTRSGKAARRRGATAKVASGQGKQRVAKAAAARKRRVVKKQGKRRVRA
jgi:predicted RNase H-like HicB family nuclease